MTASVAIEVGVLGAASVLGVSKLYDMETNARRWPDSAVVFAMLLAWGALSVFSLYSALVAVKGVKTPGSRWLLLAVIAMAFLTHALKATGLLQTGVHDHDQKRDARPPIHPV